MIFIFIDEEDFFNKLIYNEVIFEPLDFKTKDEDINFVYKVVMTGEKLLKDRLDEGNFDNELYYKFKDESSRFLLKLTTLYQSYKENETLLMENEFISFPFKRQIQMWCTFIESQSIYSNREVESKIRNSEYFTGMETQTVEENKPNSLKDNLEAILEVFDTLIKFLHFKSKNKIEGHGNVNYENISPYYIPSIEQISHLTNHKILLENTWEQIKFKDWDFNVYREDDSNFVYYYTPPNVRNFKLERAGIIRKSYHEYQNTFETLSFDKVKTLREKLELYSESVMNKLFSLEPHIFEIGLEIIESKIQNAMVDIYSKIGEAFYEKNIDEDGKISLNDIYCGFSYLISLGYLYGHFSHERFDESNFKMLCPVASINSIVEDFSSKYTIEKHISRKIIDYFVLKPNTPNRQKDVFSKPLVYVGDNNIVFTPYLVEQMNLNRITERILSDSNIDESIKGTKLEADLIRDLSSSSYLDINTLKVKFDAYDDKEVEYDLIAVLDQKIILIEIKCLNTPFSNYEFNVREKEVLYGVKQVNRREDILINQPEEILKRIDIDLPTEEPTKKDIIKIVCTDIYHFTGRMEDDVYIIDSSALRKFFLDPIIEVQGTKKGKAEFVKYDYIWRHKPDENTFKRYLRMPKAIERIIYNLEEFSRGIMLLSEDTPRIAFSDFILRKNPYDRDGARSTTINIGRNDKCFCGSNKKYKKCCGI